VVGGGWWVVGGGWWVVGGGWWVVSGGSLCVPYGVGNPRHKNLVSGPKYVDLDMHVDKKLATF
jgi:hypothetical protein